MYIGTLQRLHHAAFPKPFTLIPSGRISFSWELLSEMLLRVSTSNHLIYSWPKGSFAREVGWDTLADVNMYTNTYVDYIMFEFSTFHSIKEWSHRKKTPKSKSTNLSVALLSAPFTTPTEGQKSQRKEDKQQTGDFISYRFTQAVTQCRPPITHKATCYPWERLWQRNAK